MVGEFGCQAAAVCLRTHPCAQMPWLSKCQGCFPGHKEPVPGLRLCSITEDGLPTNADKQAPRQARHCGVGMTGGKPLG